MKRTREAALDTREGILDAAEHQFFERGVSRTTLEHIARAAGVTRGAVYWHFRNKAELFSAMMARVRMPLESSLHHLVETAITIDELERHCISSLVELQHDARLRRVYTVLLLQCEYSADMQSLVERERAVKEGISRSLARLFARLQDTGQVLPVLPPRLLALGVYAYMLGLFTDYLRTPEQYRMPEDAEHLVGYFFAQLESASSRSGHEP